MHHTLPSEVAYHSNVPFFANANGLVFGHGSSTSASSSSTLPAAAERTSSANLLEKLSEKGYEERSEREYGWHTEAEMD